MKTISKDEVNKYLNCRKNRGLHIDSRLMDAIKKDKCFYLIELNDEESFLSLIWHEIDASRLLTPKGESRCLQDVANRFNKRNYTFEKLSESMNLSANQHDPHWFEACIPINNNFEYENFGWIVIQEANENEMKQSPCGTFYIYDGAHKSLVLATKLKEKEIEYKKIEALLIPRS